LKGLSAIIIFDLSTVSVFLALAQRSSHILTFQMSKQKENVSKDFFLYVSVTSGSNKNVVIFSTLQGGFNFSKS
jgi:diphthamide biosynthesis methyltransferase